MKWNSRIGGRFIPQRIMIDRGWHCSYDLSLFPIFISGKRPYQSRQPLHRRLRFCRCSQCHRFSRASISHSSRHNALSLPTAVLRDCSDLAEGRSSNGRTVPKALIPEQARNAWSHLRLQSAGMTLLNPEQPIDSSMVLFTRRRFLACSIGFSSPYRILTIH
jgi:hypothetical protein